MKNAERFELPTPLFFSLLFCNLESSSLLALTNKRLHFRAWALDNHVHTIPNKAVSHPTHKPLLQREGAHVSTKPNIWDNAIKEDHSTTLSIAVVLGAVGMDCFLWVEAMDVVVDIAKGFAVAEEDQF